MPKDIEFPGLNLSINLVETPQVRTTALQQVALGHLDPDGSAVWFDARVNAATYLLNRDQANAQPGDSPGVPGVLALRARPDAVG